MDVLQFAKEQFKGSLGQFQVQYADIKSTYFEYEGETMEELEKKVSKGVWKVHILVFLFWIPISLVSMALIVKIMVYLFEEMQRQGK